MADLNDLSIKPISEMDRDELVTHILKIRNARRGPLKATNKKSSAPAKRQPAERKPEDLLSMLSPEQAQALLDRLEE